MPANDSWADQFGAADEALLFAEELGAIPKFPSWSKPAVSAVAEVLAEICSGPKQAGDLVKAAIRTMTEWGGIPGLRAIYAEQHDTHMEQSWKTPRYWDGGPADCSVCADTGAVQDKSGDLFHECTCAEGNTLAAAQHVQALNREIEWARTKRMRAKQTGNHRRVNHEEIAENLKILEGKAE